MGSREWSKRANHLPRSQVENEIIYGWKRRVFNRDRKATIVQENLYCEGKLVGVSYSRSRKGSEANGSFNVGYFKQIGIGRSERSGGIVWVK